MKKVKVELEYLRALEGEMNNTLYELKSYGWGIVNAAGECEGVNYGEKGIAEAMIKYYSELTPQCGPMKLVQLFYKEEE